VFFQFLLSPVAHVLDFLMNVLSREFEFEVQTVCYVCIFVFDFNEITPSKLLRNNIEVKEKFCVLFTLITKMHMY
jgi:hypothetical protein